MERIIKDAKLDYDTYSGMVDRLSARYSSLKVASCGKTLLGREIYALTLGSGQRNILFAGGVHGTEWITGLLLLRFTENLISSFSGSGFLAGFDAAELLSQTRLIVVPEVNPDGIEIALKGESACGTFQGLAMEACGGDFSNWNANARGVDINHNFDAGWVQLHEMEEQEGITGPAPKRFGGNFPESEPETEAMTRLCRHIELRHLLTFHAQGEELYYEYGARTPKKALTMAKIFSSLSDYTLVKNEGLASHGGFKDWFIEEFGRPAFTVEAGRGKNPLPLWEVSPIYDRLETMMMMALIL